QRALDLRAAHDFAHGAFGDFFQCCFGGDQFEQIIACIADAPQNNEFDVDDVFVTGQHQAFLRHADAVVAAETDFDTAVKSNVELDGALDRPGQAIAKAGFAAGGCPFAECQQDGVFAGVDAVKTARQPKQDQND